MAKKKSKIFGIGTNTIVGKFLQSAGLFDLFDDLSKSFFKNGLTTSEYEKMAAEDEYLDENREEDYMIRKRAWEEMDSPEAQMRSQAKGLEAVGMNKMAMAGNVAAGASSSTAEAAAPSGNVSVQSDISSILNSIIGLKHLELDEKETNANVNKTNAETKGIELQNENLPELLDLQKGDLRSKINFLNQEIESEPVKRALLRAEISYRGAQEAVQRNIGALQKIDLKYHDAYQAALTSSAQAFAQLQWTHNKFEQTLLLQQLALNTKQIEIMNQTIVTGKLNNGLLAKQFQYYDSDRKFNRWNTGVGTAFQGVSAVAGLATGAGILGKASGMFQSPQAPASFANEIQRWNSLNPYKNNRHL